MDAEANRGSKGCEGSVLQKTKIGDKMISGNGKTPGLGSCGGFGQKKCRTSKEAETKIGPQPSIPTPTLLPTSTPTPTCSLAGPSGCNATQTIVALTQTPTPDCLYGQTCLSQALTSTPTLLPTATPQSPWNMVSTQAADYEPASPGITDIYGVDGFGCGYSYQACAFFAGVEAAWNTLLITVKFGQDIEIYFEPITPEPYTPIPYTQPRYGH